MRANSYVVDGLSAQVIADIERLAERRGTNPAEVIASVFKRKHGRRRLHPIIAAYRSRRITEEQAIKRFDALVVRGEITKTSRAAYIANLDPVRTEYHRQETRLGAQNDVNRNVFEKYESKQKLSKRTIR